MGYKPKRGKIADWAPNHPFAHEQISFVPKKDSSASHNESKEQQERILLWEQKLQELDDRLRASGLAVTVETAPSDDEEYLVVFPPNRGKLKQHNLLPPGGSHGVKVSVSWGYEPHDVHVSATKWKRIRAGEPVMVRSVGWYEGQSFECRWYFDLNAEYTLIVSYGDDGADGFIGNIRDATIESVDGPQR